MKFGGVKVERKVPCLMRDGITLFSDIYRPEGPGLFPVLLMRQPYGRMLASTVTYAHPVWFAQHGYMVVIQDVRGRGESEGEFMPFVQEVTDGYDTVEWAAALPDSNGKVGMYGFSYQGTAQWAAAAARPPHLTAIAPGMCSADLYHGMFYPHGRFAIGSFLPWAFQLARDEARRANDGDTEQLCTQMMRNPDQMIYQLPVMKEHPILKKYFPFYYEWCAHPAYDDYWKERNLLPGILENPLPALHTGGWFDNYLEGTLQTYDALRGNPQNPDLFHRLIIGPWGHIPWGRRAGGADYGPEAEGEIQIEHLKWFDYWLKDKRDGLFLEPAVRYYELESRSWKIAEQFSFLEPAGEHSTWKRYLASSGKPANGASGGGRLSPKPQSEAGKPLADVYVYDSRLPMSCHSYFPLDRSLIEDRYELLNYTSEPLEETIHVAGSPKVSIWCQALEGPTDLVVILTTVQADGTSRFLSIGREEIDMDSGRQEDGWLHLQFSMRPFAARLAAGASIRIEITGSAFPLFVRHPNGIPTGKLPYAGPEDLNMATVAVAHSESFVSFIVLPVTGS